MGINLFTCHGVPKFEEPEEAAKKFSFVRVTKLYFKLTCVFLKSHLEESTTGYPVELMVESSFPRPAPHLVGGGRQRIGRWPGDTLMMTE